MAFDENETANPDSITVHGFVDRHVTRVGQDNTPRTIRDHLIMDGINDVPVLDALYRQIYQGLKIGGPFSEHLGSVYVLRAHKGGRQPEGFGDDPPFGHDKLKPDASRALLVMPLNKIAEGPNQLLSTTPAVLGGARALATITSKRKQVEITAATVAVDQEKALLLQRAEFLEEKVAWLERENESLRTGRPPVTALPGRRSAAAPAANGNGGATH